MTEEEWNEMTDQEKFTAYNDLASRVFPLEEQISTLRQKVYLLRKILKWKGDLAEDKPKGEGG
jgi:hypothetical protein